MTIIPLSDYIRHYRAPQTDKVLIDVMEYLISRGFKKATFERLIDKTDHSLADITALAARYPKKFRTAWFRDGPRQKQGIKLVATDE